MTKITKFTTENIGASALGHLVTIGVIVLLTDVVISFPERFVAPDRIQITMIDLNSVRVSGDETILYNTNTPPETDKPETKKKADPEPKQKNVKNVAQPIETTSLIKNDETKEKSKSDAKQDKNDDTPAPKKKTVVRVNRNVLSLDRTLTVSVVDALRVAMTRCWNIDPSRPDISGMRVVAHMKMRKNGTVADVWFESAARAETDVAFAYVLDTIRAAINTCQPLRMLPAGEYNKWRDIQLTFYPTQGKVL